jgi:hypothetical protein
MPQQPLNILQRMRGSPLFGADVVKHVSGPLRGVSGHRDHDRGADEKQDAGRLIDVAVFEQAAEGAADEESPDYLRDPARI